ncbi:MAG: protein-disulfide isomerase [Candidatus Woesearchaeota archaeon]|jgi:protein-disulfide isomerase
MRTKPLLITLCITYSVIFLLLFYSHLFLFTFSQGIDTSISSQTVTTIIGSVQGEIETQRVLVIEFTDFQCDYCAKNKDVLSKVSSSDVFVKRMHFPVTAIHQNAYAAALAYECVDLFTKGAVSKQAVDALFARQSDLSQSALKEYAIDFGLNQTTIEQCFANEEIKQKVNRDLNFGLDLKLIGTPSYLVIPIQHPSLTTILTGATATDLQKTITNFLQIE